MVRVRGGRKVTPELLERALMLLREQVPPSWVAEDIGVERSTITKLSIEYSIAPDRDWAAIQLSIRKNGPLSRLHAEIAPPKARGGRIL